jgi:hypothetical protein
VPGALDPETGAGPGKPVADLGGLGARGTVGPTTPAADAGTGTSGADHLGSADPVEVVQGALASGPGDAAGPASPAIGAGTGAPVAEPAGGVKAALGREAGDAARPALPAVEAGTAVAGPGAAADAGPGQASKPATPAGSAVGAGSASLDPAAGHVAGSITQPADHAASVEPAAGSEAGAGSKSAGADRAGDGAAVLTGSGSFLFHGRGSDTTEVLADHTDFALREPGLDYALTVEAPPTHDPLPEHPALTDYNLV